MKSITSHFLKLLCVFTLYMAVLVRDEHIADSILDYQLGLNISDAPDIAPGLFVGRQSELRKMEEILLPHRNPPEQQVVVLGGLGGIGKTQLAMAYIKRHRADYDSVFWLDASSEETLKEGLRLLLRRVQEPSMKIDGLDNGQIRPLLSAWLSEKGNDRWLLILDNYDDPKRYEIKRYYPQVSQGSIIITTRLPEQLSGNIIYVRKLERITESIRILETRSGRTGVECGRIRVPEFRF